jgi:hypothetical protein
MGVIYGRGRSKLQIRNLHHFDFINETQERLCSAERKRGRAWGITKKVTEQQKNIEKRSNREKQQTVPSLCPQLPEKGERTPRDNQTGSQMVKTGSSSCWVSPHLSQALNPVGV